MPSSVVEARYNLNILSCRRSYNLNMLITTISIRHLHISHNVSYLLPKSCITFVFHFSWVLQPCQEKLKTTLTQNFGGQISCIMGNAEVAYKKAKCDKRTMKREKEPAKITAQLTWKVTGLHVSPVDLE